MFQAEVLPVLEGTSNTVHYRVDNEKVYGVSA